MKKLLTFVLAFLLSLSVFATGCNGNQDGQGEQLSRAEISTIYMEVAESTWEMYDYQKPETNSLSLLSVDIPDKKVETTNPSQIENIKINMITMGGFLYMLGSLYTNEAFVVTDGYANFDATISIGGEEFDQNYLIKSSIDKENGKIYFESVLTVDQMSEQYSYLEIVYDFTNKEVKAFNFITKVSGSSFSMYNNMALTEDGKNLWYDTNEADDFTLAVDTLSSEFKAGGESIEKLTTDFSTEMQVYFDVLDSVIPA